MDQWNQRFTRAAEVSLSGFGNTFFKSGHYAIGSCPAALRFALSAARSVFTFYHRAITAAESRRALAQAATSRAVGAASGACIVIAAAIMAVLTESSV